MADATQNFRLNIRDYSHVAHQIYKENLNELRINNAAKYSRYRKVSLESLTGQILDEMYTTIFNYMTEGRFRDGNLFENDPLYRPSYPSQLASARALEVSKLVAEQMASIVNEIIPPNLNAPVFLNNNFVPEGAPPAGGGAAGGGGGGA